MQKNNPTANIERDADTSRFTKRIGSVTFEVNVFFNQSTKETMSTKIQRLIRNDVQFGKAVAL